MRRSIYFPQLFLLLGLFLLLSPALTWGQCVNTASGPTGCVRSNFFYGEITPNTGTVPVSIGSYGPGYYFRMPVLAGACYSIGTCGAPFDTHINCFTVADQTNAFAYDDDNGPLCGGLQASVTMVPSFTDYAHVDVRQYYCAPGGSSSITITVQQNNNLSITSPSGSMCQGQTRTLSAVPAPVTGAVPNSGSSGSFSGAGVIGSTFTAPVPASNSQAYTVSYTFGYVSTTQSITVFHAPTTANAGPNQTICATSATLSASPITFGAGQWSTTSSAITIASPTSPTSGITGLVPGSSVALVWTTTNGPCAASRDTVVISVDQVPTTPNAGTNQAVCNDSIFLAANTPTIGSGSWNVVGGGASTVSPSNPNSMIVNLGIGANTAVWSISNGVCPTLRDTVVIFRDQRPSQPLAGPDKYICGPDAFLTGNIPAVGTGTWTRISGTGVVTSPTSPNSSITQVNVGTSVLTWTIANGTCPVKIDTMLVTRNALPNAPTVNGPSTACFGSAVTLSAVTGAANPTIIWWDSLTGGNVMAAGQTYSSPPLTSNIIVYAEVTDGNTFCSSTRTPHPVTVVAVPAVQLGADTTFCASETVCLDAGPGMTSYQWNTGATSRVLCTNVSGTYWVEIADGNGCHGYDTINVIANIPPVANLGPDFTQCIGNQNTISVPQITGNTFAWSTGATTHDIIVNTGGTYSITITDFNNCSSSDTLVVTQQGVPAASFTVDDNGCPTVLFTDQSTAADTWSWSFGNGFSSSAQNPNLTYASNGNYTVTLISSSQCGADTSQQLVMIDCIIAVEVADNLAVTVYPNPNDGQFRIHFDGLDATCELLIFNDLGQQVYARNIEGCGGSCDEIIDIKGVAAGIYFAKMKIGELNLTKRVLIR